MAEMSNVGPSKSYLYKEELMKEVQSHILDNLENITSKEEMDKAIDSKTKMLHEDMAKVLEMIGNTMKNVPLDVLKRVK